MTLADISSLGSLISGIAVLGSLVFVGVQLRQNTLAVRAAASQAHSANYHAIVAPISENADLARIWLEGISNYDGLGNRDRMRFIVFAGAAFRFFESARLQWRHGQLDGEHWQAVESNLKDFKSQPGIGNYWKTRKHWHSAEFQDWFELLSPSQSVGGLYDQKADVREIAGTTN